MGLEWDDTVITALDREIFTIKGLQQGRKDRAKWLEAKGIKGEEKNERLAPVIVRINRHRRLFEQIASEFGLPPKYPLTRALLHLCIIPKGIKL